MRYYLVYILKCSPILVFMYSLWLTWSIWNMVNAWIAIFLLFECYGNWLAILMANTNCLVGNLRRNSVNSEEEKLQPLKSDISERAYLINSNVHSTSEKNEFSNKMDLDGDSNDIWYCQKCCQNRRNCYHCPMCNKCIFKRHHHCFFLGTCISVGNMKHFIVILFYVAIISIYAEMLIIQRMNLLNAPWATIIQHFLPISVSKWLISQLSLSNLMEVMLLNITGSLGIFACWFFLYHMFLVVNGKLNTIAYRPYTLKRDPNVNCTVIQNFHQVFGSTGLSNFLIPVSLVYSESLDRNSNISKHN